MHSGQFLSTTSASQKRKMNDTRLIPKLRLRSSVLRLRCGLDPFRRVRRKNTAPASQRDPPCDGGNLISFPPGGPSRLTERQSLIGSLGAPLGKDRSRPVVPVLRLLLVCKTNSCHTVNPNPR